MLQDCRISSSAASAEEAPATMTRQRGASNNTSDSTAVGDITTFNLGRLAGCFACGVSGGDVYGLPSGRVSLMATLIRLDAHPR